MKRILVKLIVQPVWIDLDDSDNAEEKVSKPEAVPTSEIQAYIDALKTYMERAKRGEIDPPKDS